MDLKYYLDKEEEHFKGEYNITPYLRNPKDKEKVKELIARCTMEEEGGEDGKHNETNEKKKLKIKTSDGKLKQYRK